VCASLLRSVVRSLAFAAALGLAAAPTSAGVEASRLEGTWFVLIHYRDVQTANPESDRWLDKVWTFEMRGSRLHWVEYPIVVFESQAGRFEAYKGNPRSRVLAKWEPNALQQKEIDEGPRVNSRGSKSKSLRGNDTRGWKTVGRSRVAGANVVGYHENWLIEPNEAGFLFEMREEMGNAATGTSDGLTLYEVEASDDDGNELRGSYDRDGTRTGTFRMTRTAPIRTLLSSEEEDSVNRRHMEENADRFMDLTR